MSEIPSLQRASVPPTPIFSVFAADVRSKRRYVLRLAVSGEEDPLPFPALSFSESARGTVIALARTIYDQFIGPAVLCERASSYLNFLQNHLEEFDETLSAMRSVVARLTSEELAAQFANASMQQFRPRLSSRISAFSGAAGSEELDFALDTHEAGYRVVGGFLQLPEPTDPERDKVLCRDFAIAEIVHFFSLFSLMAISAPNAESTSSEVVETVFKLLRDSALMSYAAAREALELRTPSARVDSPELPFESPALDEEDRVLSDPRWSMLPSQVATDP